MINAFKEQLFIPLRESERYQLTGIVETTRLPPSAPERLLSQFNNRVWPLLQQPEFNNLRSAGPWLCAPPPEATVHGKNDFFGILGKIAGDAVCGWIVSALPAPDLVAHLSQANRVIAPDGNNYMLRYHTEHSLRILHAHSDLPDIVEWLAPIHTWWVPAVRPKYEAWLPLAGADRAPGKCSFPLQLDQACWEALAGDSLSHRLADQLEASLAAAGQPATCYTIRLALAQQYLAQAREAGLTRQADLIGYVTCMVLHGDALTDSPAWQKALAETCDKPRPLADALQIHLRQYSL